MLPGELRSFGTYIRPIAEQSLPSHPSGAHLRLSTNHCVDLRQCWSGRKLSVAMAGVLRWRSSSWSCRRGGCHSGLHHVLPKTARMTRHAVTAGGDCHAQAPNQFTIAARTSCVQASTRDLLSLISCW